MKDFCRFLTDFPQLYLLHWGFRKIPQWTFHLQTILVPGRARGSTGTIARQRKPRPHCDRRPQHTCGIFHQNLFQRRQLLVAEAGDATVVGKH